LVDAYASYAPWGASLNMCYGGLRNQASSLFYNTLIENKHGWMNMAILIKFNILG